MTLPVSSYEELLTRVRTLTQETRQLQRQLDSPLLDLNDNEHSMNNWENSVSGWNFSTRSGPPLSLNSPDPLAPPTADLQAIDSKVINTQCNGVLARILGWPSKEEVTGPETKEQDERRTTPETSVSCTEGSGQKWPAEYNVWHSVGPTLQHHPNSTSAISGSACGSVKQEEPGRSYSQQQLGAKVEMVYSLLSMLGTHDREKMTTTLLAMSSSPDSCQAMRQSGCVPLLVQLVHAREESAVVRQRASQALSNLIHCHLDDKRGRREARVLRLLQQLINFSDSPRASSEQDDPHPAAAIAALMKLSFDEDHRHTMCQLGALHAIATLIQVDAETHGSQTNSQNCVTVRRYAGMALTNLTFGDSNNKALLCSLQPFMAALVAQLSSPSEDLRQVTASVLRNLSWRADASSKAMLREVGTVTALMHAAMEAKKESTLKSILSALWNLSAHCNLNKVEICSVEGALQYLVEMLSFQAPSRTLAIVESAGGILRNISSHIAVREDYRSVLREQNCLPLLLHQLKSPSLTVVSNACGTLWNLSARCPQDQRALWDLGAVPMLRSLVHSKHRMISMGASAALKNLLASRPEADILDRASRGMPTLLVRKRRALEQELDTSLSETCENIESPERWDSHESVTSTHSENIFDRTSRSHCHRSGSLQVMKRSGSCGSGNTNDTGVVTNTNQTNSGSQHTVLPLDNKEKHELQCQPSSKSPTLSLNNDQVNDEQQVLVNSMQRLAINNKNTTANNEQKCNKTCSSPLESASTETVDEKPVDYSLKYKDEETNVDTGDISKHRHISPASGDKHVNHLHDNLTIEELDMPTNYSLKYHEEESKTHDYNLIVRYGQQPDIPTAEVEMDQPTDYSLKYRESDANNGCDEQSNNKKRINESIKESVNDSGSKPVVSEGTHVVSSGHYAETDLDEALDYYCDDKVQTYCTEGTPYTFSTATSMSDLRVPETESHSNDMSKSPEESLHHSLVHEADDGAQSHPMGTPAASSPPSGNLVMSSQKEEARGCKAVTFETPLMFSRCSSPESLSSYEPPDDRSSTVSEFSRLTSGMISPSELPDSPTQTVPPSPRNIKPPVAINGDSDTNCESDHPLCNVHPGAVSPLQPNAGEIGRSRRTNGTVPNNANGTMVTSPITPVSISNSVSGNNDNTTTGISSSVFEDTVSAFKEENTPVQFSTCTSLSSLTFDDEPYQQQTGSGDVSKGSDKTDKDKSQDMDAILAPVSEEEDEDVMLAACINIGMQQQNPNIRHHSRTVVKTSSNIVNSNASSRLPKPRMTGIPIKSSGGTRNVIATSPATPPRSTTSSGRHSNVGCDDANVTRTVSAAMPGFNEDSTTEFCTEDTPANISHATSHSDLSMLCALSDDGSSDQDNILAECIQSAMPQARNMKHQPRQDNRITPTKTDRLHRRSTSEANEISPVIPQQHNSSPNVPIPNSPRRIRELKVVGAQDEIECFATEDSPCVYSTRSSLSDLTINSSTKGRDSCQVVSPAPPEDGTSPLSSLEPEVTVLSRQPSIGSLSGDWTEEQALLEQCITSGMPKTKNGRTPSVGVALDTPADENSEKLAAATTTPEMEPKENLERQQPSPITTDPPLRTDDPMQASADTWNDQISPNDISFPSISLTAPLISSYKSNSGDIDDKNDRCLENMSLTDSNIIRLDEGRVAIIANMDMEISYMSDLDSVRPPSVMGSLLSLTTSISEAEKRKDKMRGLVARRALGGDSSLSWNNIDSIKPPSGMDEILDLENSILSVASITSEVADSSLHSHSEVDSEDVTLADTADVNFDAVAIGCTQLSTSPQQRTNTTRTTPKQKRQNGKDRYNTYTINTEDIMQNGVNANDSLTDVPTNEMESEELTVCEDDEAVLFKDDAQEEPEQKRRIPRITPKQRRLADKDRFRTRTLGVNEDINTNMISSPSPEIGSESNDVSPNFAFGVNKASSTPSIESEQDSQSQEDEIEVEKGKPRVVKPLQGSVNAVSEGKGIRGKKKVYSHIPVVSKPTTPSKTNQSAQAIAPPPLQRQGTFTKDDQSSSPSSIPVLAKKGSPVKTVKKKQQNNTTSHNVTNSSQSGTAAAVRKIAGRGRAGSLPRAETTKKPVTGVRNSAV